MTLQSEILDDLVHHPGSTYQEVISRTTTGSLEKGDYGRGFCAEVQRMGEKGLLTYHPDTDRLEITKKGKEERERLLV